MTSVRQFLMVLLAAIGLILSTVAQAGFVIVILDEAGVGLNDPAPRDPVDGNAGTTLGQQRLNVLQVAADRWAQALDLQPGVEIRVGARFTELSCEPTSAVLGSAGPNRVFSSFENQPVEDVWYTAAQAEALAVRPGGLLASDIQHIRTQYNLALDNGDESCLGGRTWYYGLDPNASRPSNQIALFPVVLHEFAHGLGFLTLVDLETGALFEPENVPPREDAYMRFLRDTEIGKAWTEMDDEERQASVLNDPNVVWTGAAVAAEGNFITSPESFSEGLLRMHAPGELRRGSSISHWAPGGQPPRLMEPALRAGVFDQLDLTPALFSDLGWPLQASVLDRIFFDRFEPR